MKHAYLPLLLSLLLALPGRGQNYCPFRPGRLIEFTRITNDTTLTVQLLRQGRLVASGSPDSVYTFARRMASYPASSPCPGYPFTNLGQGAFGGFLYVNAPATMQATYEIGARIRSTIGGVPLSYLASLVFKPRAALRQPWPSGAGSAQVVARRTATVLGQPDSVVDIELLQGVAPNATISLSKNHGLLNWYMFEQFANNYFGPGLAAYQLTAWPQQGLGTPKLGTRAVYDYQVGDVLLYQSSYVDCATPTGCVRSTYYFGDSVLARTNSRTGDTISYRMYTRSRSGGGLVSGTRNLVYTVAGGRAIGLPSGQVYNANPRVRGAYFVANAVADPARNRRFVQQLSGFGNCSQDSTAFRNAYNPDRYYREKYATGLGQVLLDNFDFFGSSIKVELVAYRKGTEQAGPISLWRTGLRTLPTRATRPAATTVAYPQPFGDNLTVRFALARPQPVALALHDALGRAVLVLPAAPLPAGPQQLALSTAPLPPGLYTLHLIFGGEGRTEVVKIMKGNE